MRVSNVLGWLASGMTAADIAAEYPYLTEADVVFAIDAWCVGYGFTSHNPFGTKR